MPCSNPRSSQPPPSSLNTTLSSVHRPSFIARVGSLLYFRVQVALRMLNFEPAQQRDSLPSDRRREPRIDHPAPVEVRLNDGKADADFNAVLVNTSTGGLAIRHWRKDLAIGQRVLISCISIGQIAAHVMWNWTVGPLVISGLRKSEGHPQAALNAEQAGCAKATPPPKLRALVLAVMVVLLAMATWYVGSKI